MINKILYIISVLLLIQSIQGCNTAEKPKLNEGRVTEFGIKHPNQPNCDAIYIISEIENCEQLKGTIPRDSIEIKISGGCFDTVNFSYLSPRLRYMNGNKFSITTRSCNYNSLNQAYLDSLSALWKRHIFILLEYKTYQWLITSKN